MIPGLKIKTGKYECGTVLMRSLEAAQKTFHEGCPVIYALGSARQYELVEILFEVKSIGHD